MADNASSHSGSGLSAPFDPSSQTFNVTDSLGYTYPMTIGDINAINLYALSSMANYSAQAGACLIMFLVVLAMTPSGRLLRANIQISLWALVVQFTRTLLLALWFTESGFFEFYASVTGDYSAVGADQYGLYAFDTILQIPAVLLMEAALILQAWSIARLWPASVRWPVTAVSVVLVAGVSVFCVWVVVLSTQNVLYGIGMDQSVAWARTANQAFQATTICWFCGMFLAKLGIHMLEHRSVLSGARRDTSAMEALVMTNGVLMVVPSIFAGLGFAFFRNFEVGSLAVTSVIVFMPLGTLIAQRLATSPLRKEFRTGSTNSSAPNFSVQSATGTTGSKQPMLMVDPIDLELARIEQGDLEKGSMRRASE